MVTGPAAAQSRREISSIQAITATIFWLRQAGGGGLIWINVSAGPNGDITRSSWQITVSPGTVGGLMLRWRTAVPAPLLVAGFLCGAPNRAQAETQYSRGIKSMYLA